MEKLKNLLGYVLMTLFLILIKFNQLLAQVVEETPGEYPLNHSPLKIILYMAISVIVVIIAFKLMYKPKKKDQS